MEDVLRLVVGAIEDKKGESCTILDVSDVVDFLNYLVICSGQTDLHNRAIADHVVSELTSYDIIADGINGYQHGDWILIDYDVLVVHVFLPGLREFYQLEELWAAGREIQLQ